MSRGLMFGLGAAFIWGTHSVVVEFLALDLGGNEVAMLRLWIATATLVIVLRILKHPLSLDLNNRNLWLASGAMVVNYLFFHIGLEKTNAASAMVLENTAPFFVLVFLAFFARTRVGIRDILATSLAVLGVALTVLRDLEAGGLRVTGDILEVGAGMSWAVFLLASSWEVKATGSSGERLNFLFGVFLISSCLITPFGVADFTYPPSVDFGPLVYLGVVATALAFYLWYEAASELSTLSATLMFALSVVFTFMNSAIFLGHAVTPMALLGAALIVLGVALTGTTGSQDDKADPA